MSLPRQHRVVWRLPPFSHRIFATLHLLRNKEKEKGNLRNLGVVNPPLPPRPAHLIYLFIIPVTQSCFLWNLKELRLVLAVFFSQAWKAPALTTCSMLSLATKNTKTTNPVLTHIWRLLLCWVSDQKIAGDLKTRKYFLSCSCSVLYTRPLYT